MDMPRLIPTLKTGTEPLHASGQPSHLTLMDFWRWSTSDLVSNTTRGVFAEFLVTTALGVPIDHPREEWAAWDLTTPEGIKVEVKSTAYIQAWSQEGHSEIKFGVPKTRTWNSETKRRSDAPTRKADVYVLCLLSHKDKSTINPLDLSQWEFFVLPTYILNERTRSQRSITLASLLRLHGPGVPYFDLRNAVLGAAT